MIIRKEEKMDQKMVYEVIKTAFSTAEHSDGNEQNLVEALRKSDAFIPELSLVAEENGEILAHILFTKIQIGEHSALALAPLAVLPKYQRRGVGRELISRGHVIAKAMGFQCVVVLGSDQYYPKSGYVKASQFDIQAPFEVPDENFMVIDLTGEGRMPTGTVQYAKEFFEV